MKNEFCLVEIQRFPHPQSISSWMAPKILGLHVHHFWVGNGISHTSERFRAGDEAIDSGELEKDPENDRLVI